MKYGFTLLLTFLIFSCNQKALKNNGGETLEVTLNIVFTADYCGGAYPPDEVIQQMKIKKPMPNGEIVLVRTGSEEQTRVKTDQQGNVLISLKTGNYSVFFPNKLTAEPSEQTISKEDCVKWKETPDAGFDVTKDVSTYQLYVHKSCNPCEAPRL